MARTLRVDLEWAACGYLVLPNRAGCRHIIGLDAIAREMCAAGASLWWADLPGRHPAFCHVESRSILLAPWLYRATPGYVRFVLLHELAHIRVGHDEDRARVWQTDHMSVLAFAHR